MKYRVERKPVTPEEEEELVREIRSLAGAGTRGGPPDAYWQNLIIRVNGKIDRATSGRGLSISWAARVAIPGVVAVISFLIGLHYFVPEAVRREPTVADVVLSLPPAAIDSLLVDPSKADPALSIEDVATDVLAPSREQIADYFIENGNTGAAFEGISDREAGAVLADLAARQ